MNAIKKSFPPVQMTVEEIKIERNEKVIQRLNINLTMLHLLKNNTTARPIQPRGRTGKDLPARTSCSNNFRRETRGMERVQTSRGNNSGTQGLLCCCENARISRKSCKNKKEPFHLIEKALILLLSLLTQGGESRHKASWSVKHVITE